MVLGTGFVTLLSFCLGLLVQGPLQRWAVTAACVALPLLAYSRGWRTHLRDLLPRPVVADVCLAAAVSCQVCVLCWLALYRYPLGWDGLLVWEVKAQIAFRNAGALPLTYWAQPLRTVSLGLSRVPPHVASLDLGVGRPCGPELCHIDWPLLLCGGAAAAAADWPVRRAELSRWVAFLAIMVLAFVPAVVLTDVSATSGYADFPLAVAFLATVIHLVDYSRTGSRSAMLLAGPAGECCRS